MRLSRRLVVLAGLLIVLGTLYAWKTQVLRGSGQAVGHDSASPRGETVAGERGLPMVIDVGRDTCEPCKMMAPLLRELEEEYRGRAIIKVINLDDDPSAASRYGVYLIPTQIFIDASGKEVYRHQGYLSKEAIVSILKDMGVK
ncbi:MAG: thioredoxin family protein [Firmicutes bacterium]|jgi:thioredoxin 1|nr:thioredoxin family protein [Bacillota bacterium]MDH7496305.1 thioredoxin family protein [Bacillota bacterium]